MPEFCTVYCYTGYFSASADSKIKLGWDEYYIVIVKRIPTLRIAAEQAIRKTLKRDLFKVFRNTCIFLVIKY